MQIDFLTHPTVKTVILRLRWNDKFESDLIDSIRTMVSKPEEEFGRISDALLDEGLVYRLRGDRGSHYLALTDRGQAIADRLHEIEFILEHK
jgi:predicted transcriptional regulator